MPIRSLLNRFSPNRVHYAVPAGQRVYAVGDIHGRLDLLEVLLALIDADSRGRGSVKTLVIFLGDLVDRGPDSRGVVERLMNYARETPSRFLMGNHEEVFLRAARGDLKALRFLLRIGGRATIMSYGIDERQYRGLDFEELGQLLTEKVPQSHVEFLSSFEEMIEIGDYLFVHAGVRPGIDLGEQSGTDLRWIRDDFLLHRDSFGKLVVHGHNITDDIDLRANRIGIDTGAYESGRLSAIGLEGSKRWFLST